MSSKLISSDCNTALFDCSLLSPHDIKKVELVEWESGTGQWAKLETTDNCGRKNSICVGNDLTQRLTYCDGRVEIKKIKYSDVATIRGFECLTTNVLNVILTIFALLSFIMFIYGALMYMLSGGQPQKMEKARSTLGYVVIGLVLAISGAVILNIISEFTGVNSILTINWDAFGS
jgi:hypothetical protein